jgi:hypothetical protein
MKLSLGIVTLTVTLLCATEVLATETTSEPAEGLTYTKHTEPGQRWFVLAIDLSRRDLRLKVTPEIQGVKTVSQLAASSDAEAAINGSFFCNRPDCGERLNYACGTTISDSVPFARTYRTPSCYSTIGWSADARVWSMFLDGGPVPAGTTNAISALWAVKDGKVCDGTSGCSISGSPELAPRTLLGVDERRTRAYFVVVDGRDGASARGMTLREAARLMKSTVGAWDAINLDGGGSSALFVRGEGGIVNAPSDGRERPVPNGVVVVRRVADAGTDAAAEDAGAAARDAGATRAPNDAAPTPEPPPGEGATRAGCAVGRTVPGAPPSGVGSALLLSAVAARSRRRARPRHGSEGNAT